MSIIQIPENIVRILMIIYLELYKVYKLIESYRVAHYKLFFYFYKLDLNFFNEEPTLLVHYLY